MAHRIHRIVLLLLLVGGGARLAAQTAAPSSDVGVWILAPQVQETTLDDTDGEEVSIDFEESIGFGVSFNHFWTHSFSTDFALQRYSAGMDIGIAGAPRFEIGDLDVTSFTAMGQLHFNRAGRISPYVGAGAAWMNGSLDPNDGVDADAGTVDLESELTFAASAGANVALSERISLAGELEWVRWDAVAEGDEEAEAISLDPLTVSFGVRFRF